MGFTRALCALLLAGSLALPLPPSADAGEGRLISAAELDAMLARAEAAGRVGRARKSRPVDARQATPGEIVVTIIRGEGEETRSPPATAGDMVVRNRCSETGNEEILVKADKFAERYEGPLDSPPGSAWATYRPRGVEMRYVIVSREEGSFTFTAPWGAAMVARPGDAIVRDARDPRDTYRIAAASFACTYEILERPTTP